MDTIVSYHSDDGPARPAINVKVRAPGVAFWPDNLLRPLDIDAAANIVGTAYERVQSAFWREAEAKADELGLGGITQEGRSGGWLVFTDGRDPRDMDDAADCGLGDFEGGKCRVLHDGRREWLAAYREMREWAEAYIADAPRKVRELAQSLAMNGVGREPALRHFGFLLDRGAGSTIVRADGSTYHVARSGWVERA